MKHSFCLIGLCIIVSSFTLARITYADNEPITTRTYNLKGSVKEVKQVTYRGSDTSKRSRYEWLRFDSKGKLVYRSFVQYIKVNSHTDSVFNEETNYYYDAAQRMVLEEGTYPNEYYKMSRYKVKYTYNTLGLLHRVYHYNAGDSMDRMRSVSYSATGVRTRVQDFLQDTLHPTREFFFDAVGNVVKECNFGPLSSLQSTTLYRYGAENQPVVEERIYPNGPPTKSKLVTDPKTGLLLKYQTYSEKGALEKTRIYTYDSLGNNVGDLVLSAEGTPTFDKNEVYSEFDQHSNYLHSEGYGPDQYDDKKKVRLFTVQREISYY